jgi:large subunit ribosomal protein L30
LRRSTVGSNPSARGTVRALGLRRVGHTVEITDDPAVRGQVHAVRHLVDVEAVAAPASAGKAAAGKRKEAEA